MKSIIILAVTLITTIHPSDDVKELHTGAYVCQDIAVARDVAKQLQADPREGLMYMQSLETEVTRNGRPMCSVKPLVMSVPHEPSEVVVDVENGFHLEILAVEYYEDGEKQTGFLLRRETDVPSHHRFQKPKGVEI